MRTEHGRRFLANLPGENERTIHYHNSTLLAAIAQSVPELGKEAKQTSGFTVFPSSPTLQQLAHAGEHYRLNLCPRHDLVFLGRLPEHIGHEPAVKIALGLGYLCQAANLLSQWEDAEPHGAYARYDQQLEARVTALHEQASTRPYAKGARTKDPLAYLNSALRHYYGFLEEETQRVVLDDDSRRCLEQRAVYAAFGTSKELEVAARVTPRGPTVRVNDGQNWHMYDADDPALFSRVFGSDFELLHHYLSDLRATPASFDVALHVRLRQPNRADRRRKYEPLRLEQTATLPRSGDQWQVQTRTNPSDGPLFETPDDYRNYKGTLDAFVAAFLAPGELDEKKAMTAQAAHKPATINSPAVTDLRDTFPPIAHSTSQDPLRFLQEVSAAMGKPLDFRYSPFDSRDMLERGLFYWRGTMRRDAQSGSNALTITPVFLPFRTYSHRTYVPKDVFNSVPTQISRYLTPWHPEASSIPELRFSSHDLSILGDFSQHIGFQIEYCEERRGRKSPTKQVFRLDIIQQPPGQFTAAKREREGSSDIRFSRKFFDVYGILQDTWMDKQGCRDYRPYLHRMLELYWEIPKFKWHNPAVYLPHDPTSMAQYATQAVLEKAIVALFPERPAFLEDARMRLRAGFASVPSLNLGPTRLPAPGQQDHSQDYLVQGGTLLVELLAGSMGREEAEALVLQRLERHYLSQMQISRAHAQDCFARLKAPVLVEGTG